MTILTVGSNNPNFSFVIQKNPATIRESNTPFKRSVRKGVVYGWFTKPDDSEFRLWFKDHDSESSFAEGRSEEFEYLDRSRYGSPYAPIAIITECLGSVSKELSELESSGKDDLSYVYANILISNLNFLTKMAAQYLAQDLAVIAINTLPGQSNYACVVVCSKTVHMAINVMQTICIMQALYDKETYVPMNEVALVKFAKVFNRSNTPYYPRYLFKMRAIQNRDTFNKVKEDLQGPGMTFYYGDTQMQRFDAIRAALKVTPSKTLFDIGCGEMSHTLRLQKSYNTIYAVDADEYIATNNVGKLKGRNIYNIVATHATVDLEWIETNASLLEDADILMTEVIEHMNKQTSQVLVNALLKCSPKKLVVTAPNQSFNIHYGISEHQFRHPDHDWEPTFEEFSDDMVILAAEAGYSVSVTPIGDVVDDVSVSSMAVFAKEEK